MEPVGLAVGVVGLAGLFNTCLDAVGRVDSWRNFADDSRLLQTLVEGQKLRLKRWGNAVGLDNGEVSTNHHEALDDPEVFESIKMNLWEIKKLCTNVDSMLSSKGDRNLTLALPGHSVPSESRRRKMKWALRDKSKCAEQAQALMSLVQTLYDLVPLEEVTVTASPLQSFALENSPLHGPWTAELQQLLETMKVATRKAVYTWLVGPYVPNGIYENAVQTRLDGTFDWILGRKEFLDWSSAEFPQGKAKILWVNGAPGFGKSILCARIVEHLSSTLEPLPAKFFFSSDFESRRDPFVAVRLWLAQLLQYPAAFQLIREEWEANMGDIASHLDVLHTFRKVTIAIPGLTFVLDGLDECIGVNEVWDTVDKSLDNFLTSIQKAVAKTTTRVLIVSRSLSEIRQSLICDGGATCVEYTLSSEDVQADVEMYARSIVDKRLHNKAEDIKNEISMKLAARCKGQFLWVKLQEPSLRKGKNKKQLEAVIDRTPDALNQIYDRDWQKLRNLSKEDNLRAISLLRWAAFALRPLTVAEVTEALLITDACDDFPQDEMPDSIDQEFVDSEILGLCGSLVEIRHGVCESNINTWTVHLTHFSVKEFFISRISAEGETLLLNENLRHSIEAAQNGALTILCLKYLNFRSIWQGSCTHHGHTSRPFFNYTARYWYRHAAGSGENDIEALELINSFVGDKSEAWHLWKMWYNQTILNRKYKFETATPLHYATELRLPATVRFLISTQRYSIDAQVPSGETALALSCNTGDAEVAMMLLEGGASLTIQDCDGWTPLCRACLFGHVEVAKLLLQSHADPNGVSRSGFTPLHGAALNHHVDVVKLLIDHGAHTDAKTDGGWHPLHLVATTGQLGVAKSLLDNRANVSAVTNNGWTPLHLACRHGPVAMIELLFEYGADAAMAANNGWTPLHTACFCGQVDGVKQLLEGKSDMNALQNQGRTPLAVASLQGHTDIVDLLFKNGSEIITADYSGCTPLHLASMGGHAETTRLLVRYGSPVDAADHDGRTAVFYACSRGQMKIVEDLLSYNINFNTVDIYGASPLFIATKNGHDKLVSYLLNLEFCYTGFIDGLGQSLLWWASQSGNQKLVEIIIHLAKDKGVEVCERDLHLNQQPKTSRANKRFRWCDGCMRCISADTVYYKCDICDSGTSNPDFDLCEVCLELGIRCLFSHDVKALLACTD